MACSGLAEDQLAASVHTYLGLLLFENAKFLCERLVASCPSEVQFPRLAACSHAGPYQLPTRNGSCVTASIGSITCMCIRPAMQPTTAMRAG